VSVDTPADNRAFAEKFEFPFQLLSDPQRKMGVAYGACKTDKDKYAARYTYVIGPDGRIKEAIDTKDPAGQAATLLEKL
jgi:peroxiredoxin Q/BCP